jgi:2-polyprenyl-6-methoxyphenol hydroxylase-like FAD-dependent oxidoreductase
MLLALLLARKGVKVLVLEQHKDFEREYRGEVLMPRFTQMMRQIGLDEWLLTLTHLKLKSGEILFKGKAVGEFDFSAAAPDVPYALWMPQPVLLRGLHERGKAFPSFEIWFGASAKHLIQDNGVRGVEVRRGNETVQVRSRVVVGCDGRYSTVLKDGGFEFAYEDHKFDLQWFSIPKPPAYDNSFRVLLSPKRSYLLLPKYPDEIQVGILTEVHGLQKLKSQGIAALKAELREASPLFEEFADRLEDFSAFHPLQAHLHLVREWAKDGCLLIGDSAHCCSPAGAIGVSVAAGSALVAADVLWKGLKAEPGILPASLLAEVQRVREPDVRMIHTIQKRITGGALGRFIPVPVLLPVVLSLLVRTPFVRGLQRKLMALPAPLPISPELSFAGG